MFDAAYIFILKKTGILMATERLYDKYINCVEEFQTPLEKPLSALGAALDQKVESHTVTLDDLADYEEAAKRAGFYAGFRAAIAYTRFVKHFK